MTPREADILIVRPTLEYLEPPYASLEARLMLLAIGMQETGFKTRYQLPSGPGLGLWQVEYTTEMDFWRRGKLRTCARALKELAPTIYESAADNDHVAATICRSLLWERDPKPLPAIGDIDAAWACYLRVQRPGRPSRKRWTQSYATALAVVRGA